MVVAVVVKPLHRNGLTPAGSREAVGIEVRQTIDLCRSEKGQEIRSNAEKLKVKFAKAWEEEGSAKQEVRKILCLILKAINNQFQCKDDSLGLQLM